MISGEYWTKEVEDERKQFDRMVRYSEMIDYPPECEQINCEEKARRYQTTCSRECAQSIMITDLRAKLHKADATTDELNKECDKLSNDLHYIKEHPFLNVWNHTQKVAKRIKAYRPEKEMYLLIFLWIGTAYLAGHVISYLILN